MTKIGSIKITNVDRSSPHLPAIKALWRAHATTLGFFPEGAFDAYAEKKLILVAEDSSENLLGYLLYRITPSRNDASIVHLCVDTTKRNKGIAALLVRELQKSTQSLRGIGLRCRRDFSASKIWPKLGFVAISEKVGKSLAGSTLTFWWYDHNHPTLFTMAQEAELDKKKVVIDANVFFDLKNETNEESMALRADWLDDSIAICTSDELLNEINRASHANEREACRAFLTNFRTLVCDSSVLAATQDSLKKYLPDNPTEQDYSDFAHLAKAIAADADFFITRDEAVLSRSDKIYDEFGIPILRPSDFITELDALYREREYQPARLAGTLYAVKRVQGKSEDILLATFQNSGARERQVNFKNVLRKLLASPLDSECYVAWDQKNKPIGLMAYSTKIPRILKVELLRAPSQHPLATTIVRFQIGELIKAAYTKNCSIIHVTDEFLDGQTKEALHEDHFITTSDGWFKFCLHEHVLCSDLITQLDHIEHEGKDVKEYVNSVQSTLRNAQTNKDIIDFWQVEAALSPGMITDAGVPCFIVPIKPYWAQQLFDEHLAKQDLFGAKVDLALNREGIYYRSLRNSFGISAPARILWYVSKQPRFLGSGSIRAHSRLEEVIVNHPKPLYRQFRRLGIYEWKDVLKTAKSDENQLMAMRFSNTVLFEKPLPWDELIGLLSKQGIKTQLQSPCPIPESLFFSLVSKARI